MMEIRGRRGHTKIIEEDKERHPIAVPREYHAADSQGGHDTDNETVYRAPFKIFFALQKGRVQVRSAQYRRAHRHDKERNGESVVLVEKIVCGPAERQYYARYTPQKVCTETLPERAVKTACDRLRDCSSHAGEGDGAEEPSECEHVLVVAEDFFRNVVSEYVRERKSGPDSDHVAKREPEASGSKVDHVGLHIRLAPAKEPDGAISHTEGHDVILSRRPRVSNDRHAVFYGDTLPVMHKFFVPRALLWILAIAIVVRLLLFGYLFIQEKQEFFVHGDSNGYLRIANNLVLGNGFSQFPDPPYLPDSMRVPLFPTVLGTSLYLFDSYVPLIILQIFLSGVIVIFTYLLTRLVAGNERLSLVAASLLAFEPYSVFISTAVLTETLFAIFLIACVYAGGRFIRDKSWVAISLSSLLFGFAALTRPIGEFLPIVLILIVLLSVPIRAYAKYLVLAIVPFLIVAGPWFIRNYIVFGVPALSSGGLQNAYSDLGGAIIGVRDHVPSWVAKQQLEEDFSARHGSTIVTIQQDLSYGPTLFKEALGIMFSNPMETVKALTSITIAFFTHDMWLYYPQRWEFVPRYDITFSPSYVLMTEGPVAAFRAVTDEAGWTLVTPVSGRLFWAGVVALFFIGMGALLLRGGEGRLYALFLLALVLYLLALTATVGFGINGRFRYPVNALFFTGAAIGGSLVIAWIRARFARA